MPPLSAPTNWRKDPSSVPLALFDARSSLCGSHKSVGSDEIKAVGSQFPEFISYPDTFYLEDDNSTRRASRSESRCTVSEASVLDFYTSDLESDTSQVVTPIPKLTAIHRSAYITQADFDELQRQKLGKRKRTHSSGGPFNENPKHTLAFEHEHEHSPDTTVDDASINGNAAESRPRSSFSEGHTPSYRSVDTEEQGGGG